jgi:hypothetical protein
VPVGTADPQALARACEHLAAVRKIAAEMGARREAANAEYRIQNIESPSPESRVPSLEARVPSPETEMSSSEWIMRKNFVAPEPAASEPAAPSLYDLNDCTVEQG